mgnify:CR=1 FL=1
MLLLLSILVYKGCGGQFNNRWKSDIELEKLSKQGNEIVKAIETYKSKNKVYPKDLSQLTPLYVDILPLPNSKYFRGGFHYSKFKSKNSTDDDYHLAVFPKQFSTLGQRCVKWVVFSEKKEYKSTNRYRKIHKIVNGWSAETKCREYQKEPQKRQKSQKANRLKPQSLVLNQTPYP